MNEELENEKDYEFSVNEILLNSKLDTDTHYFVRIPNTEAKEYMYIPKDQCNWKGNNEIFYTKLNSSETYKIYDKEGKYLYDKSFNELKSKWEYNPKNEETQTNKDLKDSKMPTSNKPTTHDPKKEEQKANDKEKKEPTKPLNETNSKFLYSPFKRFSAMIKGGRQQVIKYFLATIEFLRGVWMKVQGRFSKIGRKLDNYSMQKNVKSEDTSIKNAQKFINEELTAVEEYRDLLKQEKHKKAEEILKKRGIARGNFLKNTMERELSQDATKIRATKNKIFNLVLDKLEPQNNQLSEDQLKTLGNMYSSDSYVNNLIGLTKHYDSIATFDASIHQNHTSNNGENILKVREEYLEATKALFKEIAPNMNEEELTELFKTNEIDNGKIR